MKAPEEYRDIRTAMMEAWIAGAVAAGMREGMARNRCAKAFPPLPPPPSTPLLPFPEEGWDGPYGC